MFGIIICYFGISNNTAACFGCGIATFYHKAMKKLCFAMEKGLPIFSKNRASLFWQNDHSTRGEHQHKAKLTILKPTPFSERGSRRLKRNQPLKTSRTKCFETKLSPLDNCSLPQKSPKTKTSISAISENEACFLFPKFSDR